MMFAVFDVVDFGRPFPRNVAPVIVALFESRCGAVRFWRQAERDGFQNFPLIVRPKPRKATYAEISACRAAGTPIY